MKNNKGFTLVELLVVIAIIGILSTVAVVNLNSARDKAKSASAQAALSQLTSAAILCHDEPYELSIDGGTTLCSGTQTPAIGSAVCTGSTALWPALPTNWAYVANCYSGSATSTWKFAATDATAGKTVTCTNTGCAVS